MDESICGVTKHASSNCRVTSLKGRANFFRRYFETMQSSSYGMGAELRFPSNQISSEFIEEKIVNER